MPDLLIINPNSSTNYKDMDDLKAIEPPIWAAMMAHELRKQGREVLVLDANAQNLSPKMVARLVEKINPLGILVTVFGHNPTASTPLMPSASAMCKEVKRVSKGFLSMFGTHSSALPDRTEKEVDIDEVVRGVVNRNLDKELSGIAWDLLPMGSYRAHNWHCFGMGRQPYASLYTSLGCPYTCDFCPIHAPLKKKKHSKWSPEWVIGQIETLVEKYGVKNIKIADELFLSDKKRVLRICNLIIKRDYDLNMWAYGRVDNCPPVVLERMKKAGFNWIGLGIESGDEKVKGFKKGEAHKAVQNCRDAGINVNANYMFGLPGDDLNSMKDTLGLALELNTEFANFYSCMAYPGSKLYELADPKDLPDSWEGYAQYSYECKPLPTQYLSSAEVLAFRDQAFVTYFTNPKYLKMMENKFGKEVRTEISNMKMIFERKIL